MEPTPEELERVARKEALAMDIFALFAAAGSRGDPGAEQVAVSGSEAIETLSFVIALMVEYSPRNAAPADLQQAAEMIATDIHRVAYQARAVTEETGRHPIEMFGASNAATAA